MKPLRPLHDNVIVEEVKEDSCVVTVGDEKRTKPAYGKVLAAGPGESYGMPEFKSTMLVAGDIVCFQKDLAHKIKEDGKELFVIREQYCLYVR